MTNSELSDYLLPSNGIKWHLRPNGLGQYFFPQFVGYYSSTSNPKLLLFFFFFYWK